MDKTIPADIVVFCSSVADLARRHGLNSLRATIRPNFHRQDGWREDVELHWEQGRHGEESRQFSVRCRVDIHMECVIASESILRVENPQNRTS